MSPVRIQRQRAKGWRMPEDAIYVGRGTRWGNPFAVGAAITDPLFSGAPALLRGGAVEDRAHAVELFSFWVMAKVPFTQADVHRELAGRDLACWCPLEDANGSRVPCHADVLLEIAGSEAES